MNKNEILTQIDKCFLSLKNFIFEPAKSLENCIFVLESFKNEPFPIFLEKNNFLLNIFEKTLKILSQKIYLEKDMLEELNFFIKGSLLDLAQHAREIEKDESFKNDYWQKILFLRDWVENFLSLPAPKTKVVENLIKKFLIFTLGNNIYCLPINSYREIILVEASEEIKNGIYNYKDEKIPLVDRKKVFGDYSDNFPKTILIFSQNNSFVGLEVDQLINSEDLDTNTFYPIETIAGSHYVGPIKYIGIKGENPIFVLEPQGQRSWPLTIN